MPEKIKALIAEAEAHRVDPHSGWLCCDWCSERRDQECRECEQAWPCLTRRLADALSGVGEWEYGVSPSGTTEPSGVYSREQARALADDCTEIDPGRPWVVMRRWPGVKPGPWELDHA